MARMLCYRRRMPFIWTRLFFIGIIFIVSVALSHVVNKGLRNPDIADDVYVAKRSTSNREDTILLRHLAGAPYSEDDEDNNTSNSQDGHGEDEERNCTPPTIHEFPGDLFTNEQRKKGAILLHVMCVVYMFLALAIVCDDYFVSSLEKICEHLGFSEDVAGATFMAAGSSAPELFTSVIGVFIAKGDVGVGTIVGSAVFNILVIIGICGIFAGQVIMLTWWPLFRDTVVYMLAVVTLVWVIHDGWVTWYEALSMLILYAGYIFLMWLNPKIYIRIERRSEKRKNAKRQDACNNKTAIQLEQVTPLNAPVKEEPTANGGEKTSVAEVDEYIGDSPKRLTFSDAGLRIMLSKQFPARTRLRTACWLVITEKQMMERDPEYVDYLRRSSSTNGALRKQSMENGDRTPQESTLTTPIPESPQKANSSDSTIPVSNHSGHDDDMEGVGVRRPTLVDALGLEPEGHLCQVPSGCWDIVKWLVCLPLCTLLFFTIPDCRRKRFERWYLLTFFMSIIWIMLFSYVMVWMVALIGYTLKVPDTIMGITFLAAGTSVPDAMASLIVARQGLGDMAVSNSIGSNVFDILLGLALPWFVKTTMVSYGTRVKINSSGLLYAAILLFATVFATILSIHFNGWKLNHRVGYLLFAFYAVFLTLAILVEFNVLGYVNPPMCRDLL